MKLLLPVLTSLCFSITSFCSYAQKQFSEGSLVYSISIESGKTETPVVNSLNGAELTLFLKPYASRSEMKSSLGIESTVYDNRSASGYILKEYSGQKLMITLTKENWINRNKKFEGIVFETSAETKTISGYNCSKATAKLKDGSLITVYYTPSVSINNKEYNLVFKNLPGLPVQYEFGMGKMKFTYLLASINWSPLPISKFEIPKSGFRVISYDENQKDRKEGL